MSRITTYNFPNDGVRVCTRNTCIEARGENARMIATACAIMLLCIGVAALAKAA